jgi:hypothetical protein
MLDLVFWMIWGYLTCICHIDDGVDLSQVMMWIRCSITKIIQYFRSSPPIRAYEVHFGVTIGHMLQIA